MALFRKGNKPKPARKGGPGGGILSAIGITTEPAATEADKKKAEREEQIKAAWWYLRNRIDGAIHDYYKTGTFSKLEQFVERPALDLFKQELHSLRAANIFWQQPHRKTATEPTYTVVHVDFNKDKQPTRFVIRERFRDFSVHQRVVRRDGEQVLIPDSSAPGTERVLEATVTVTGGSSYMLHSVRRVRSATLG